MTCCVVPSLTNAAEMVAIITRMTIATIAPKPRCPAFMVRYPHASHAPSRWVSRCCWDYQIHPDETALLRCPLSGRIDKRTAFHFGRQHRRSADNRHRTRYWCCRVIPIVREPIQRSGAAALGIDTSAGADIKHRVLRVGHRHKPPAVISTGKLGCRLQRDSVIAETGVKWRWRSNRLDRGPVRARINVIGILIVDHQPIACRRRRGQWRQHIQLGHRRGPVKWCAPRYRSIRSHSIAPPGSRRHQLETLRIWRPNRVGHRQANIPGHLAQCGIRQVGQPGATAHGQIAIERRLEKHNDGARDDAGNHHHHNQLDQSESALLRHGHGHDGPA